MVIPCNIDFSNKTTDLIISLGRKKAVSLIKKVISMSLAEDGQGTICARFARFAQPYIYIYFLQYYIQPHVSCSPDTDAAQQAALQNACDDAEAICLKHK
jgi:hypothetical protein